MSIEERPVIDWRTPGLLGYLGLVALVVGLIVTGVFVPPLLAALNASADISEARAFDDSDELETFENNLDAWLAVTNGRSPFFVPPRPIIEKPEIETVETEPEPVNRVPTRYGGPDILAAMNDTIWLQGGDTVRVGDTARGVTPISLENLPWSVRVEWEGVEFDVDLFERTTSNFLK